MIILDWKLHTFIWLFPFENVTTKIELQYFKKQNHSYFALHGVSSKEKTSDKILKS